MKKSLAKLRFYEINKLPALKKGVEWRTPTIYPDLYLDNCWTIRCIFVEDLSEDNTIMAEIQCLKEAEPFIHVVGKKIQLFGAKQFKCECEIIKDIIS